MYSIFDIFKIGIGPSSSHTVGPMKAAKDFIESLKLIDKVCKIDIELYGSLAFTGRAHGTEKGIILGLEGYEPTPLISALITKTINSAYKNKRINIYKNC